MVIGRFTPAQQFTIWAPRYKDKKVLLACHKVGTHNEIRFTKAKHLGTDPYYVSGETVRNSPKGTNGSISVYEVDLDKLEPLERK